jgi:hypothetical protein
MRKDSFISALGWGGRVWIAIHVGMIFSYFGLWAITAKNDVLWRADFTAYYTAWDIIRAGQGAQLYNLDTQTTYQLDLLDGGRFADGVLPYNYPPYMALALYPLSWFSLSASYWIFALIQILILGRVLQLLISIARLHGWNRTEILFLAIIFCSFPPLFNALLLGNFTLLVLWGWVELYRAMTTHHDRSAALWLVLTTAKLQHTVFYGVVLLAGCRWKTLFLAFGVMIGLVIVTSLALGPTLWPDYIKLLAQLGSVFDQYGITVRDMINFKGLLVNLLGEIHFTTINLVNLVAWIVSALVVAWLWRGTWNPQSSDFSLKLAFSLTLGLMFSPHSNVQDALFLVFPVFLFYLYLRQHAPAQAQTLGWLALGSPTIILISEFLLRNELPFHLPFLLLLGLAIWMGNTLRQSGLKRMS